ncbi:unnamed protein product [Caenorhabditis bovis]|uniref:Vacuolar protein sorting-associated protein 18 homolog n=1 Tax=Caenorhabditis bovis TaxID=2654633 RepID=A0A8S1EUM7_9PELO|nr:unnamed protein product [Caenorhabditis bovis]
MPANLVRNQNGIFIRTSLDIKKDLKVYKLTNLSHLVVKNGELLAAITDKILLRQSVSNSERHHELVLPLQPPDAIAHVHLAFTGFHAIVSTKMGLNYYVHMKTNTFHLIKKLKCIVTAVGWNPECLKESETGPILLGTQQGSIVELSMSMSGICNVLKELTPQLQPAIDEKLTSTPSKAATISEIQLFIVNDDDDKLKTWMAIITQTTRIVILSANIDHVPVKVAGYASSVSLQAGFISSAPETPSTKFHPFFSSKDTQQHILSSSKLSEKFRNKCFLALHPASNEPTRFAWVSPDGIAIGRIDVNAESVQNVLTEEINLEHRLIEGRLEPPVGVVLTDYHLVLAYSTRVLAVSLLTPNNVVFEDILPQEFGPAGGFSSDPSSDFMWLHTTGVAIKYRANDEARLVWKTYLDRREFNKALQIARTRISIDPEAYEMVLRKQADWYIDEKNYTAAAEILAQSSEPFESVVLKFLSNTDDRRMGLKTLLEKKLDRLNRHEDRMKRDALVIWLLEVQLSELSELRRARGKEEQAKEAFDHLQRFVMRKNVFESVQTNLEAVYRTTVSHADFDMQYFIANTVKDIRTMVNILMLREQYVKILELLHSHPNNELCYEMSPILIEYIPKQLVNYFIEHKDRIRADKLSTALALCVKTEEMAVQAIKYLEIVMNFRLPMGKFLHNLFVQLMAKYRSEKLIVYFKRHGTIRSTIPYDFDFAMRTCEQAGITSCIVYLYCVAEMYSDAVEKALEIDVELAKEYVRLIDEGSDEFMFGVDENSKASNKFDAEYKKQIWIKIAKHVIKHNSTNVPKCLSLIEESGNTLTIQDLLPLFPEFTKIDEFKDALISHLKRHSKKIKELQENIKDATQTAEEIREKTEKLKNRVTVIKASDVCSQCSRPLAGRPFFVHSCRHFFHRECLENAIYPFLDETAIKVLNKLVQDEIRLAAQIEAERKVGTKKEVLVKEKLYEKILQKISKIIGSDCPFCGTIAISQIDKPFLTDQQFAEDENSWLI